VIRNPRDPKDPGKVISGDRPKQMELPVSGSSVELEAVCTDVIFRNEENGYTVAVFLKSSTLADISEQPDHERLASDKPSDSYMTARSFTAVGYMPFLEVGDYAGLSGIWVNHGMYGMQLQADRYTQMAPRTPQAILQYLSSGTIHGIGPRLAEKIISAFGSDTLRVIREEPEKLSRIKGITRQKAVLISRQMAEKGDFQELSLLMTPFGLGMGKILSIYRHFGSSSMYIVKNNPYRLADEIYGIGFRTADSLAAQFGCDPASPFRIGSALIYCLKQAENEGHTFLPLPELFAGTQVILSLKTPVSQDNPESADDFPAEGAVRDKNQKVPDIVLNEGYHTCVLSKRILPYRISPEGVFNIADETDKAGDIRIAFPKTIEAEISSAKMISRKSVKQLPVSGRLEIEKNMSLSAVQMDIELAPEQKDAILMAASSYVSVITGGPGTGKTTIIRVLTDYFNGSGQAVVLCAPTGRAAKRMTEATGLPAKTIHRLLEMERGAESNDAILFKRNEENPIEADVIIADEVSMLDVFLLSSLLRAVADKTQIVFVGDQDQLPSVGSGNVLSDIIQSTMIPVVKLTQIFRQAAQSRIVLNAHRILKGEPILFDQSFESDCMLVHMDSAAQIAQAVASLCSHVLPDIYGIDVLRDTAVLCPSRKGPAGVQALNLLLQSAAGNTGEPHMEVRGFSFRISDKVMQTRNHYDLAFKNPDGTIGTGVFNGELGIVLEIDSNGGTLTVELDDGRQVIYDRAALDDLDPAYAVTVHKSQGSEFPVVVLAITPGSPMLNNRNLLYTAITRAKKKLFIVSDRRTLNRMIHSRSQSARMTSLCALLRIYCGDTL